MFGRFSLALLLLTVGSVLTVVGFFAYSTGNSTLNLIGFFYGIPVLLGGAALKSSEVKPAQLLFSAPESVLDLRNTKATLTQNKVRKDVTRFRYGIKAHLDEVLEKLGMSPTDEERPLLTGFYEEISEAEANKGSYSLVLRFNSPLIDLAAWQEKQEKLTKFFGPGIVAVVSQPEANVIDLRLITNS